jgi:UDP-glucose:(heptosyl)LPS alpha-1,3-glucosyltransferase
VHKAFLKIERKSKLNPLHPIYLFLEKRCFNNAQRIIANSYMIKNEIVNTYCINEDKIDVVYNGVELKRVDYTKSYNKLTSEFSLDGKTIILYVGSGFKRKGVEEFLHIISKLKSNNIMAFIIGKEKRIEHYHKLAQSLKIDNIVQFTGPRIDVDDFYQISDIFILPTHYEPFSNVILEAMNLDNVVFTTKQNGASEILESEYIMGSPDDFSIIKKINYLMENDQEMKKVKCKNMLKAKELSIENNLLNTLNVIKKVI